MSREASPAKAARPAARRKPIVADNDLVARASVAAGLLAWAALPIAALGARIGVWNPVPGLLAGLSVLVVMTMAALIGSGLGLFRRRPAGKRRRRIAIAGGLLGAGAAGVLLFWVVKAVSAPPINDVTTDTADPPMFDATVPDRVAAGGNARVYAAANAPLQVKAYPDIKPILVAALPQAAFESALATAKKLDWRIVAAEPAAGTIEATATSLWFGFKDDVVIRVRPSDAVAPGGSRVDLRSASRLGKSDVGANAARIAEFARTLDDELAHPRSK